MKSSIKIDYASIWEGIPNEKQPIIRIDLQESDDPRDTLLNELVTPQTIFDYRLKTQKNGVSTYVLSSKNRYSQVSDISVSVYLTLLHLIEENNLLMATSNDEIYFHWDGKPNDPFIRSKGNNRDYLNTLADDEIRKLIVEDFKDFQKK